MSDFRIDPIGIWTGSLDTVPLSQSQELAAELEELGYGAVWLPEVAGRDVFVHLAMLLSATKRMVGATGIASIWARDAVAMNGAVKGLTEAFPERVLVGLGVSHHTIVQDVRGHVYERPLAAMREYLERMDKSPYTAFRPTTPSRRVLAALGPKMLELSAAAADGAHPYFTTPEHTATAREVLGEGPLLCPEQAVLLTSDPEVARLIGRAYCTVYTRLPNYANNLRRIGFTDADFENGASDRLIDAIVAWGSADQIVERVRAHFDAGADHVGVQMLPSAPRGLPLEQWRELAAPLRELGASVSAARSSSAAT
jgi:probable F420-dependent oxidoreductase